MIAPACSHPEEAREPLPYDGIHPADPDDWRCDECGATNLRLDRRSYEDRVKAAEAERLAEIELARWTERQTPAFKTRDVETREGKVVVIVPEHPAMDLSQSVADVFDKLYEISGVAPVLSSSLDMMDVSSMFDSVKEAVVASRQAVIQGGFDPAKTDSDLTTTLMLVREAGSLALKRVDHVEFSNELFRRSMIATMDEHGKFAIGDVTGGRYQMMGWPLKRGASLAPFAFRIVGS